MFTLQSSPLVSRKGSSHTTSPVSSLALTSDDTRLAAGLLMGIVLVIDVVSGKTLHQLIMDPSVDKPIDSLALIQSNGSKSVIISLYNYYKLFWFPTQLHVHYGCFQWNGDYS